MKARLVPRYAIILCEGIVICAGAVVIYAEEAPLTPPAISESSIESEELELLKEEETVSIASRYEQPISQAPSNVYVITDEDIRQSGATDLPTVLRRIPGMEVMQTTGAEFNVSVRGDNQLQANKLLVLVDGRSIYVDAQALVYWKAIPVTLPEIKRIEVLKGPASAVYGFNAFDGVINIITKSPDEMKGTTVQFGGGEFGTITSAAVHAGTIDNFGYRLSVGHDQNQQWRNRDALAFRSNKFNAQTEYAFSDHSKLSISGGLTDVNRFDGAVTEVTIAASKPVQSYAYAAYERTNFFVRAWWAAYHDTTTDNIDPQLANFLRITDRNGSSSFGSSANTYNIEAQQTLELGTMNRLNFGVNYRHNTLSSDFISQSSEENRFGLYLQDEWKISPAFNVVAGIRYDLDTFIHSQFSPRLALIYSPAKDHTFRFGVAVAYRPPTLAETHLSILNVITVPTPIGAVTSQFPALGSSNLNPEEIVSYDLGYQGWFYRHRLRFRADLFFNHLSNLINFLPTGPGIADPVVAANGGSGDIYGGEVGAEYLATRWLSGFANFAYEEISQTFTGTAQRGAPRFKFNAGVRGEWDNGLTSEAALFHVSSASYPIGTAFTNFAPIGGFTPPSSRVGSYNLLNMRAGYRFWQQKAAAGYMRDAEVAVSVFNALNDEHKEYPLGDLIGRRVMGWLTVRF